MADILSQDEIDSLLAALQTGSIDADEIKEKENDKKIVTYDFRRPNKFSKEQLKTIQVMGENFARLISTYFAGKLRARVNIKVASVEQLTYEEFVRSIPNPTILNIFDIEPLEGKAILELNPDLMFFVIDKLFGGPGVVNFKSRPLTEIEQNISVKIVKEVLAFFTEAWENIVELHPEFENLETNPTFSQIVSPTEMVILTTYNIQFGEDTEGFMNICIPCFSLEPIANNLSARFWYGTSAKAQTETIIDSLKDKVKKTHMDITTVLGESYITIRDLLDFRPGDVINLEKKVDEEVDIFVEKKNKFKGKIGLNGKMLAVQISRPVLLEEEEDDQL